MSKISIEDYDKIRDNLVTIKAIAESLSSISDDEQLSAESTKTLGYKMMCMCDEAVESLRKTDSNE